MKPVSLIARAISASSKPGDIVLDPFAGAGSSLVAAEGLSRRSLSMEIDPHFADVIIARAEFHTGSQARLLSRGESPASDASVKVGECAAVGRRPGGSPTRPLPA